VAATPVKSLGASLSAAAQSTPLPEDDDDVEDVLGSLNDDSIEKLPDSALKKPVSTPSSSILGGTPKQPAGFGSFSLGGELPAA
jgi:hypothetical protein